jgi:hypothetical protein
MVEFWHIPNHYNITMTPNTDTKLSSPMGRMLTERQETTRTVVQDACPKNAGRVHALRQR